MTTCKLLITWFCLMIGLVTAVDRKAKEYNVDLDLPPEDRWLNLLQQRPNFKEEFRSVLKFFLKQVPEPLQKILIRISTGYDKFLPKNYAAEIKGIANYLNISIGDVVLPNILYDFTAFCTSVVAQDSQGTIWHGRNLDYPFTEQLRNITAVIHFRKQNKTVYTATTFIGMVGVLTGQRPNAFTISLDERKKGNLLMNFFMALFDRKAKHAVFLIRDMLEEAKTFDEAVRILQTTDTIAPAYYIVGGVKKGEGAVITRGRLEAINTWLLEPQGGRWFLVETNYDHWLPPPKGDDRRHPAMKYMTNVGQKNISATSLYKVLSTPPLLRTITAYTTIMSAAHPESYSTMVRHYNQPWDTADLIQAFG